MEPGSPISSYIHRISDVRCLKMVSFARNRQFGTFPFYISEEIFNENMAVVRYRVFTIED
jgi:hypothetical protein